MTRHESQNEKILDQFGKQADAYAKLTASQSRTAAPSPFFEAIAPLATDQVLDVACGSGRISVALANLTRHVTGIDLTPAMILQARALQEEAGVSNIDWRVGDVLPLPFPDHSFSLVVSQAAFHHFADPGAVLKEMARVCTLDGRIAVNDMSPDPRKADALNAMEKLRDPSHVRALPPAELIAVGTGAGLRTVSITSYASTAIPLDAVLATSFPEEGDLERVRACFRDDVHGGADTLGVQAAQVGAHIMVRYPMTTVVWQRA
jgi:ubiquinone/menaquinone biosynthesis C-methylase UbiE